MIIIEKCPFCGGEADFAFRQAQRSKKGGIVFVRCGICGAQSRVYETDNPEWSDWDNAACRYAAAMWNRRYSDDGRSDAPLGEY